MALSLKKALLQSQQNKPISAPLFLRSLFVLFVLTLFACDSKTQKSHDQIIEKPRPSNNQNVSNNAYAPPIDLNATRETQALLHNLKKLSEHYVLFGHQDDLAYGVNWINEEGGSDVKDTAGAYPAITGWELGGLALGHEANLDAVNFKKMEQWIKDVYLRGGINTISWHMYNPATGKNAWSGGETVKQIVPGGEFHDEFKKYLDQFVSFNQNLKVTDPNSGQEIHIPIIFRPWHEHNGDWFWWSKGHTSEEDYRALWHFTVSYLRDTHNQHNLLYAFSPDRSRINLNHFRRNYLWGYPGDEYIDIIGIDNYHDLKHTEDAEEQSKNINNLIFSLEQVVKLAEEKNKLSALSEGGADKIENPNFWTDVLLAGIKHNEQTRRIAYALVWRNANKEKEGRDHFYAPYPEHPSVESFRAFYKDELILFNDGLNRVYEINPE